MFKKEDISETEYFVKFTASMSIQRKEQNKK